MRAPLTLLVVCLAFGAHAGDETSTFLPYGDGSSTQGVRKPTRSSQRAARPAPLRATENGEQTEEQLDFETYSEETGNPERAQNQDEANGSVDRSPATKDVWLSRTDDPNTGLAAELVAGLFLLESARGSGSDAQFGRGARVTWEFGRITGDEALAEALFMDALWQWTAASAGTTRLSGDSTYHLFTVAPAYAWPLGKGSPFALFVQAGAGVAYQLASIRDGESETRLAGVKPALQYGLGLRGRPLISDSGNLRVSFRIEVTRFRRAYMDDTFLGGSVGVAY